MYLHLCEYVSETGRILAGRVPWGTDGLDEQAQTGAASRHMGYPILPCQRSFLLWSQKYKFHTTAKTSASPHE